MNGPIDEVYLRWLYSNIGYAKSGNPSRTHWKLAKQFYQKEFVWLIPNDDNRATDGRALRFTFLEEYKVDEPDSGWLSLGCDMLEMLIALSFRLHFITGEEPRDWFWNLVENMGISMNGSSDRHYNAELAKDIDTILNRVIWRTYSSTGEGGLFPLPETKNDQRQIEIWYQMSEYLADDF